MAYKHKFNKGDIVKFANRLYKIESYQKGTFAEVDYNLESVNPDENGYFEKCYLIPEGFINVR